MKFGPALALFAAVIARAQPECAACHSEIARAYAQTAMARSFSRASNIATGSYDHAASETHFAMIERGGEFFQRRYQIASGGEQINVDEKRIDFVMGSGNHARTFLHRTPAGTLQQLPLAWYSEKGGTWAMNPGYDKPDQPNARRRIEYECMFCHNAYPRIPGGSGRFRAEPVYASIPEGIDCARCHGPGATHIAAAASGASSEKIRAAIVNPARLSRDRQREVCDQCHLETTSFPFPHAIVKYDRHPFSYQPGEPPGDFMLRFDHPEKDRFQIVSSAYRLRTSQCFLKSGGALQCTTCHDPHRTTSVESIDRACMKCHTGPDRHMDRHMAASGCSSCHMPKRRTADVVHAVMTDHAIERHPPAIDPSIEIAEPHGEETMYRGEVQPYDPQSFRPEDALYLALAQVREGNNLERGIPRLAAALAAARNPRAEFFVELGDAWIARNQPAKAVTPYREALRRAPDLAPAQIGLADAYEKSGDLVKAAEGFRRASAWRRLGEVYLKLHLASDAIAALRNAIAADPEDPAAHYDLGLALSPNHSPSAEAAFREAIRLRPGDAPSHMNLAIVLFGLNQRAEAADHFQRALKINPDYALAHLNYAKMLEALGQREAASEHFKKAAALSK